MTGEHPVLHIHIDGGSRGNPGDAGFGVHVETPDGETVTGLYGYLGRATNNVAEYQALIHALRLSTTGQAVGPGVYDCLALLGKERSLARIDAALVKAASK